MFGFRAANFSVKLWCSHTSWGTRLEYNYEDHSIWQDLHYLQGSNMQLLAQARLWLAVCLVSF